MARAGNTAGYVEKTLASDETIRYAARFNWTFHAESWSWIVAALATAGFYVWLQFIVGIGFRNLAVGWALTGVSILLALLFAAIHFIYVCTTEIAVTTFRLVFKTGWIARNTQEVSLNKIEEITLHQSILGRIFNFGVLVVRGTGVGVIDLPNLDDPIGVRKHIENARAALRQGSPQFQRSGEED